MNIKTTKTFKLPKTIKRMISLNRGTTEQKNSFKDLMIQAILTEQVYKNTRGKTEKTEKA